MIYQSKYKRKEKTSMSKVLLINGSPNEKGCTYTALAEIMTTLQKNGIETELVYLGKKPIAGCILVENVIKQEDVFFKIK